jgi:hypothetical protein
MDTLFVIATFRNMRFLSDYQQNTNSTFTTWSNDVLDSKPFNSYSAAEDVRRLLPPYHQAVVMQADRTPSGVRLRSCASAIPWM